MNTPATILIADHGSNITQADIRVLQNAGHQILHTNSGKQCLEIAQSKLPDLILASHHLTDMSGTTLCQRLKAEPDSKSCTVLLFSPINTSAAELAEQTSACADGYISLPILSEDLLVRIRSILQIKHMAQKSSVSLKDYREMLETTPIPYQSLGPDGRLVRVNRAWLDALGYKDEKEVVGRSFKDFLDPEGKKLFSKRFQNFKLSGRICCQEFEMRRKDNTPIWVSFDGRIACDDQGKFKQTHCMFQDISTRKKLEQTKEFQPDAIMRPYYHAIAATLSLCGLAASTYILGFHDLQSPLVPMGMGLVAAILFLSGYLFFRSGRHIHRMIQFYVQKVGIREQALKLLNENLEAIVDQKTRALSESEKNTARTWNHPPLALFVTDKAGQYLEVNPAACDLLGYSREEYLQLSIPDLTPHDQRALFAKNFKEIRRTGTASGEYILEHKNGSRIYVNIEAVALADIGYLAFCQDISKRKKMEKDLLRSKKRLEALATLNAMGHAPLHELTEFALETAVDLTKSDIGFLAFVDEDETTVTMHAWSQQAMKQCSMENPTTIFNAEDSGSWIESLRSRKPYICNDYNPLMATGKGCPIGHIPITRHMNIPVMDNGHVCIIAGVANKTVEYDRTDSLHLTLLMQGMWDILKHRQDEEKIRSSEERLRITLESIGDGVIATDTSGNIRDINPVAEHLTGWSRHEACGKHLNEVFKIIHAQTKRAVADPAGKIIRSGQADKLSNQTILVSKNGSEHHIANSGAPIRDAENNISGAVLVFRDVTEENRTRQELQKMQKLQSIGTLAGGIAHDFNNILMGLFGYIELAKSQLSPGQPAHTSLNNAEQSVDRAVRLAKQLLTFSKGGEPIKENVGLAELVEEVARFDLSGSSVKPMFNAPEDLWSVDADRGQIQQVLSNLTINAKQAMPEGGHLHISLKNVNIKDELPRGLRPGNYVCIRVRDEGSGIAPADLDHIFDPYFTTKNTGNGLGLATVYTVIQKHGGHIEVTSQPGYGTTFTIHLPASSSPHKQPQETPPPEKEQTANHPAHILVMDDEEMIREVMTAMLQRLDYMVTTASEGTEAITLYKEAWEADTPFDAVIMDLTIPGGMGGKEAVSHIKAINPDARVIVSSGYADDTIMANPEKYGFSGVAVKPYTLQKLQDVLQGVAKG